MDSSVLENKHLYSQYTPHSGEKERERRERELKCSILNFSFKNSLYHYLLVVSGLFLEAFSPHPFVFFLFFLTCCFESVFIPRKTGSFLPSFTRQRSVSELCRISFWALSPKLWKAALTPDYKGLHSGQYFIQQHFLQII